MLLLGVRKKQGTYHQLKEEPCLVQGGLSHCTGAHHPLQGQLFMKQLHAQGKRGKVSVTKLLQSCIHTMWKSMARNKGPLLQLKSGQKLLDWEREEVKNVSTPTVPILQQWINLLDLAERHTMLRSVARPMNVTFRPMYLLLVQTNNGKPRLENGGDFWIQA